MQSQRFLPVWHRATMAAKAKANWTSANSLLGSSRHLRPAASWLRGGGALLPRSRQTLLVKLHHVRRNSASELGALAVPSQEYRVGIVDSGLPRSSLLLLMPHSPSVALRWHRLKSRGCQASQGGLAIVAKPVDLLAAAVGYSPRVRPP